MTVRGFVVSDEWEGTQVSDEELRRAEAQFRTASRHTWCGMCHNDVWATNAFVWPRNGFGDFPLDFAPGVAGVVQGV